MVPWFGARACLDKRCISAQWVASMLRVYEGYFHENRVQIDSDRDATNGGGGGVRAGARMFLRFHSTRPSY